MDYINFFPLSMIDFKKQYSYSCLLIKSCFLSFVLLLNLNETANAQVYTAVAKLDTTKILIGEQTQLTIDVRIPADIKDSKSFYLKWHNIKDTITSQLEILSMSDIDTSLSVDKKTYLLSQKLTLTCFDSGFFVIPPFKFLKNGDSLRFVETQALLLEVIPVAVDTTQAIKDIKEPLDAPFTLSEALPYIIIGLIVIIVILTFVYFINKRKNRISYKEEPVTQKTPDQKALELLGELQNKKLWQEGKTKEYYTQLTEIIRIYIQERYGIMAMEQTSDEIISSFRSIDAPSEGKSMLKQILDLADYVKFAKINPLHTENELSMRNAIQFISVTKALDDIKSNNEQGDYKS